MSVSTNDMEPRRSAPHPRPRRPDMKETKPMQKLNLLNAFERCALVCAVTLAALPFVTVAVGAGIL